MARTKRINLGGVHLSRTQWNQIVDRFTTLKRREETFSEWVRRMLLGGPK